MALDPTQPNSTILRHRTRASSLRVWNLNLLLRLNINNVEDVDYLSHLSLILPWTVECQHIHLQSPPESWSRLSRQVWMQQRTLQWELAQVPLQQHPRRKGKERWWGWGVDHVVMMISPRWNIVLSLKRDCTSVFNFQCCTLILVRNEQSMTSFSPVRVLLSLPHTSAWPIFRRGGVSPHPSE